MARTADGQNTCKDSEQVHTPSATGKQSSTQENEVIKVSNKDEVGALIVERNG